MIKWKKQCEFCNKNLRMKTEIEAITNKRSFSESSRVAHEEDKMCKYARGEEEEDKRRERY
jgi:hypothetical protein